MAIALPKEKTHKLKVSLSYRFNKVLFFCL